jgi:hypothetical protein
MFVRVNLSMIVIAIDVSWRSEHKNFVIENLLYVHTQYKHILAIWKLII